MEKLYRESYEKLVCVAFRLTGDIDQAMDLVQDVFMLALSRSEELKSHPAPEGWLMKTLENLVRNERRRLSSREITLDPEIPVAVPEEDLGLLEILPSGLLSKDRKILNWRFREELSHKEIGDRLGISENACRALLHRVLERCRKLLKEK